MSSARALRGHEGFVLLALLAVLLAGASAAALFGGGDPSRSLDARAAADAHRLARARDALLAYTASYPELYGPTGAGPGRLPCPDTDESYRLAGPNPPCGRGAAATGKLPEHVTVPGMRVGLDARYGREPIRYRLDARAANNPPRRDLVAAWRSNALAGSTPMATLSLGDAGPSLHVRADALMGAVERRVASWVVAHASPPADEGDVDVLALVTRQVAASANEGEPVDLVEGVPRSRHWFAADGWAEAFEVAVESACNGAPGECRWRIDGGGAGTATSPGSVERARIRLVFAPVRESAAP